MTKQTTKEDTPGWAAALGTALIIGWVIYAASGERTIDTTMDFRAAVSGPVCEHDSACYKEALSRLEDCLEAAGKDRHKDGVFHRCATGIIAEAGK